MASKLTLSELPEPCDAAAIGPGSILLDALGNTSVVTFWAEDALETLVRTSRYKS